jgi:Uri superfamily endonuclease
MTRLDSRPGTYALILVSSTGQPVQVGKRGRLIVRPGFYVYVGSAFGPGGLGARVARHCREQKRLRWHIDYLRAAAAPDEVWYTLDPVSVECRWAEAFRQMPGSSMPMDGFGASDCSCRTHLFYFPRRPSRSRFRRLLRTVVGRSVRLSAVRLG